MSFLRPSDPTPAPDPAGHSDIHTTALVSALTMVFLWALQSTVFKSTSPPADLGYIVSTIVSYGIGQASGRIVRARRKLAAHKAASSLTAAPTGPPEPPAPATP